MQRVGEFEKVSFEQFYVAMKDEFGIGETEAKMMYDLIDIPKRSTVGSAGYDFMSPVSVVLAPGASAKIPTGIRVKIDEGWWLCCAPRSGLGTKYRMQLDNTIGVIDSDYYNSDNEGTSSPRLRMTADRRRYWKSRRETALSRPSLSRSELHTPMLLMA